MQNQVLTLSQVADQVRRVISGHLPGSFWIKAEMNKLNHYPHSGHCYPEVVEKEGGRVKAQMRANLWSSNYRRINAAFQATTGEPLKNGIKILFLASVNFHPIYGLSLNIQDIDPAFTLGDLEREKAEVIQKLHAESVFEQNRSLAFPVLPKRLAIISVETSNGWSDFKQVLEQAREAHGFSFYCHMFPSLLQGDGAIRSMQQALGQVKKVAHHFDLVAIIRGGGGDVGLSCYNNYQLARTVATFPLPVLSGIGHSTNQTVVEMVSHQSFITPTELGELMVRTHLELSRPLDMAREKLTKLSRAQVGHYKTALLRNIQGIKRDTTHRLVYFQSEVKQKKTDLKRSAISCLALHQQQVDFSLKKLKETSTASVRWNRENLEYRSKYLELMDPAKLLKRGYSITTADGKPIVSARQLSDGQSITTQFYAGKVESKITKISD